MASWHGIGKSLSAWTIALEKREIERERERESIIDQIRLGK